MMSLPIAVSFVCHWSVHVCLKRPGLRARSGCPSSSALVSLPRPDVGPAQQQRAYPALSPLPGGAGSERSRPQPHLWRLCGGVLIALFGVGNLAGRVADLRTLILPALVAVGAGHCSSPWPTASGPFAGAAAGRDWHGQPDRRRQCGAAAFWPQGWGKRAALSATLSFTAGLALGPVFSGLALQQDLYPTTLPFLLILGMAACAIGGWC